jgi:uncharacterized protein YciI
MAPCADEKTIKAARWIFGSASAYGCLTLLPMFFFEPLIAARNPPPLTHPEFFYGFLAVALAFQLLFALIAWQPRRLSAAIPAAITEKYAYGAALGVLFCLHRIAAPATILFAGIDVLLGTLFLLCLLLLKKQQKLDRHPNEAVERLNPTAAQAQRFLVVTTRTGHFNPRVLEPHYGFLASLKRNGILLDAGGFSDHSGGAYVIAARSLADAESITSMDPLHTWGASKLTVHHWKSTTVDIAEPAA